MQLSSIYRAGPLACILCLGLVGVLEACAPAYLDQRTDEAPNAADTVRAADLTPRFPKPMPDNAGSSGAGGARGGGFLSFGSPTPDPVGDAAVTAQASQPLVESADGYTLNFTNSPVVNVAKAVLGDILDLHYTIDPRAQGMINLSSTRPIPKKDILYVFESALHASNLVMVKEAGGYRIASSSDGGAFGATDRAESADAASPGYGMTVIPLTYVSAPTIMRLIEGFATRPGTVRADPSGRLILVVGTSNERRTAIDTVRQFDVDWMRGQSVGLIPVRSGNSTAIASALEKILDSGEAGLGHGLVKIQDVSAQNAILVVATRPQLLQSAARYIERLDNPDLASGVHVYKVRFGDAKQLAGLLNSMFSSGSSDTDANQTAPGAGSKQLSVTDRLTGGSSQQQQSSQNSLSGGGSTSTATNNGAPAASGGGSSTFGGLQSAALNSAFAAAGQGGSSVLPGVRITADTADNAVLVYGSAENYRVIQAALQQIDRPRAQVAIDVTIAEVTLNDQLNYGVQFYLATHFGSVVNSATGLAPQSTDAPTGFNVFVGSQSSPHAIINALHQLTDVRVLSNPSLVVVDNQEATLEVGDQVPVATGSATVLTGNNAVVNTIDYKNTGIILDVIPRVSPDNTVQLDISQEISNVVDASTTTNNSSNSETPPTPTISERKVKSEITVTNGQMVLLAGLVSETVSKSRDGIPVLDQLPVVGGAFGSTGKQRQRTELIMLIKPQIIRDSVDASRVAEQLRAKMRGGRIDAVTLPNALQVGAKPF